MIDDIIGILLSIIAVGLLFAAFLFVEAEEKKVVEEEKRILFQKGKAMESIEKCEKKKIGGRSCIVWIADSLAEGKKEITIDNITIDVENLLREEGIEVSSSLWGEKEGIMVEIETYKGGKIIWIK